MEQEQLEHGHSFTLREFLNALRKRGDDEKADQYEAKFSRFYCPPLTLNHLLTLPFYDLCASTALLKQIPLISLKDPTFPTKLFKQGQTRKNSNFRFGTWYLKKMGEWPQKQEF